MEPDYKQIAEQLLFDLIESEDLLRREADRLDVFIAALLDQGVITQKQYEDKVRELGRLTVIQN